MSNKRPGSNYGNTNSAYKKQKKDGEMKPPSNFTQHQTLEIYF